MPRQLARHEKRVGVEMNDGGQHAWHSLPLAPPIAARGKREIMSRPAAFKKNHPGLEKKPKFELASSRSDGCLRLASSEFPLFRPSRLDASYRDFFRARASAVLAVLQRRLQ
jgi:hypothetical protein